MADRSIRLMLTANVTGLVSGLKTASQAAQDFGGRLSNSITKNEQHINTLSNTLGGVGLALTAGFGYAVKTFMDFDAAMSSVAAATMTTGAELESLRQAAIDAGAATSFSATEAAGAIENLAKAGVSTADILGGALMGSLDLAAAGELGVAEAAEIAATAMTQFNLTGDQMSHVADVLAAGAGKAQGDVTDLAQALKYAGIPASQLGISLEETTGTLALFAQNGILGEQAGTSFRSMLMSLTAPSKIAQQEMEKYNFSLFDGQGKFIGLEASAGLLEARFKGLSDAERNAALGRIFGNESISAANVLVEKGAEGVREWTAAVDDQGYAAEQAAARLDNLKGDLEGLGGSFESLILESGSGANEVLRGLVQGAESVVDALGRIPTPVLNATTLIAGTGGLALLGVAGMGKLAIGINNARLAVEGLGMSMRTAKIAAGVLGGAIGVAAIGLTVWAQNAADAKARTEALKATLDEFGNTTTETLSSITDALSKDLTTGFDKFLGRDPVSAIDLAERMGLGVRDLTDYISGQADAIDRVNEASVDYLDSGSWLEIDDRTGDVNRLKSALDDQSSALSQGTKETLQKAAADEEAGITAEAAAESTSALTGALTDQTSAVEDGIQAISDMIDARNELAGVVLTEREAQRQYEQALDDVTEALEKNGVTTDITTAAGRENEAALDDIAQANGRVVAAMQANGASQAQIQAAVQRSRDDFLRVAASMGIAEADANALANSLQLIPGNYTAEVFANTDPARAEIDRFLAVARSQQIVIQARVNADPSYNPARAPHQIARADGGPVTAPRTYVPQPLELLTI